MRTPIESPERPGSVRAAVLRQRPHTQQIRAQLPHSLALGTAAAAILFAVVWVLFIATNTSLARDGLKTQIEQAGGLSGAPLKQKSLEILKHLNNQLNGKLPIISVGGISSGDDVQQRLEAGASLVQVYSGWIFEGPLMLKNMARELLNWRT